MGNIQNEKSGLTPMIIYLSNDHLCTRALGIFTKFISKNISYAIENNIQAIVHGKYMRASLEYKFSMRSNCAPGKEHYSVAIYLL